MEDKNHNNEIGGDSYVPDAAISNPNLDRFRRWPFAQRIAQTITARKDPSSIVIGIYGAWGEGKTTVLNFIRRELETIPNIVIVKFNPWRYGDEITLLRSFFTTIADALNKSLSTKVEKLGEWLEQYGSVISPISLTLGGIIGFSPSEGLKDIGRSISSVELETLRDRIENSLYDSKTRIVVLMDDIDRLDKNEVNNVFRLIKLTADFSYTAYILAFDNKMVAAALRDKYPTIDSDAGQDFLDKIIQVPLHLPKADKIALRTLCFEGIDNAIRIANISISQDDINKFVRLFIDGLEIRLQTPRIANRYTNALLFALPFLKNEIYPIDLMLIEGIRIFYPKLYTLIRNNRDMFLKSSADRSLHFDELDKGREAQISSVLDNLNTEENKSARSILKDLFPRFTQKGYGPDWDKQWTNEKRISSSYYFDRYFSYSIPEGDIPDEVIDKIISSLPSSSIDNVIKLFNMHVTSRNADNFVLKLRGYEKILSTESAKKIGVAIAMSGHLFPNPEILWFHETAFVQATILVARLSHSIPSGEERLIYAQNIINNAEPLPFAIEAWRWFRSDSKKPDSERKLTLDQENIIGLDLAKRIKKDAQIGSLYLRYPRHSYFMLAIWENWIAFNETNEYLSNTFKESRNNVIEFLNTYIGTGWSMETGLPSKSELTRDQYDMIVRVVDPDIVLHHLHNIYGDDIYNVKLENSGYDVSDKTTALRFSTFYDISKKEKKDNNSKTDNGGSLDATSAHTLT
jgi:hypothetical protein